MLRASASPPTLEPPAPAAEDAIARIEAWVASYLDGQDGNASLKPFSISEWQANAIDLFNPRKKKANTEEKTAKAPTGWQRIAIARKHGATVVRLKDAMLLKESDLKEFADELGDLIDAGSTRIVLDFQMVDRLSCGILPILSAASRKCSEGGLGDLRVCNVHEDLAPVLGLCPLTRDLSPKPDEAAAVGGPWPGGDRPRPLPEALLAGLLAPKFSLPRDVLSDEFAMSQEPHDAASPPGFRLVVQCGKARGRSVAIRPGGLVIGREAGCHVRSDHAFLSRRHAKIWADHGSVLLKDLGSTNGTEVNGRPVGPRPVALRPGDRIGIGPLKFMLDVDHRVPDERDIVQWLGPDHEDDAVAPGGEDTVYDVPASSHPLKREVIEGVLVLTPLDPELLSGSDVDAFREELAELLEKTAPHRIVVNLKLVPRLSNAAVGLLVAHHIRLDRIGGGLRLCEPHVRVAEVLNQIRIPLLLDVYSTEDEAVLSAWERKAG